MCVEDGVIDPIGLTLVSHIPPKTIQRDLLLVGFLEIMIFSERLTPTHVFSKHSIPAARRRLISSEPEES